MVNVFTGVPPGADHSPGKFCLLDLSSCERERILSLLSLLIRSLIPSMRVLVPKVQPLGRVTSGTRVLTHKCYENMAIWRIVRNLH